MERYESIKFDNSYPGKNRDGYHSDGIGFAPTGEWCGECTQSTCHGCEVASKLAGESQKE